MSSLVGTCQNKDKVQGTEELQAVVSEGQTAVLIETGIGTGLEERLQTQTPTGIPNLGSQIEQEAEPKTGTEQRAIDLQNLTLKIQEGGLTTEKEVSESSHKSSNRTTESLSIKPLQVKSLSSSPDPNKTVHHV